MYILRSMSKLQREYLKTQMIKFQNDKYETVTQKRLLHGDHMLLLIFIIYVPN